MKQISIFNHKGGVAKITVTFYLGWMLASMGKKTMVVDCDPQCNLTGIFLGDIDAEDYLFESQSHQQPKNIRDTVRPCHYHIIITKYYCSYKDLTINKKPYLDY